MEPRLRKERWRKHLRCQGDEPALPYRHDMIDVGTRSDPSLRHPLPRVPYWLSYAPNALLRPPGKYNKVQKNQIHTHTPMMQRDLTPDLQGLAHCLPHYLRQNLRCRRPPRIDPPECVICI